LINIQGKNGNMFTEDEIREINNSVPYEQGIFKEPYGIDTRIKEPVVYMRWESGGMISCWGSEPYSKTTEGEPNFDVLDVILKKVAPQISYLQYKGVEKLIRESDYTDYHYYGNYDEYSVKFIVLSELEELLKTFL